MSTTNNDKSISSSSQLFIEPSNSSSWLNYLSWSQSSTQASFKAQWSLIHAECTKKEQQEAADNNSKQQAGSREDAPRLFKGGLVDLGNGKFINTLLVNPGSNPESDKTLVMTHGYGAALGFYHQNFKGIRN